MSNIEEIIEESIIRLVGGEEGLIRKADQLIDKHMSKVHFIPLKYRVLGGFLQSLNIKFGDFIETLLDSVISAEPSFQVISEVSGKNLALELEENCERLIDEYINNPPRGSKEEIRRQLPSRLGDLYTKIFSLQNLTTSKFNKRPLDVNVLFKHKDGVYYYLETKYNDDHDTGKFQNINRKFLKTYAGLVRYFKFENTSQFKPILYYFNPTIRYDPNPYLRENIEILRGKKLFEKFKTSITYKQIEDDLTRLSETLEEKFDEFREKIFKRVKERSKQSTLW